MLLALPDCCCCSSKHNRRLRVPSCAEPDGAELASIVSGGGGLNRLLLDLAAAVRGDILARIADSDDSSPSDEELSLGVEPAPLSLARTLLADRGVIGVAPRSRELDRDPAALLGEVGPSIEVVLEPPPPQPPASCCADR